jgi:hypothetical protein
MKVDLKVRLIRVLYFIVIYILALIIIFLINPFKRLPLLGDILFIVLYGVACTFLYAVTVRPLVGLFTKK